MTEGRIPEPQRKLVSVEELTRQQRRNHQRKRILLFAGAILLLVLLGLGLWELWIYQPAD